MQNKLFRVRLGAGSFFFLALLLGDAAQSETTRNYRTTSGETSTGVIEAIDPYGGLKLSNGATIQPWGLSIVDRPLAEKLLVGLTARCAMLPNIYGYRVGDCAVYIPDSSGTFGMSIEHDIVGVSFDLFVWLPHFDVARPACTDVTRATEGTLHTWKQYRYICSQTEQPLRRFQRLESIN